MALGKSRRRAPQGRIVQPSASDRYSEYPSNGLTPQRLASIFRAADGGDVYRQMELFSELEEKDPHLAAQLQTRKQAVTGLAYEILPYDPEDKKDKQVAEFVAARLEEIEDWQGTCMDLLDAIGKGYAVAEITWGYRDAATIVKEISRVDPKRCYWDDQDQLRVIPSDGATGIPLEPDRYIIHQYKGRSGHPARGGILRVVAWMYLFKNYSLKDWVSFCDVYGMPLRLGKYARDASDDDIKALTDALRQLGTDASGAIPNDADIQFVESAGKATAAELYERLARYADEQISKAVLGQTLTSDSGGGSYAQSKTHNEVRHDLTVADCKALAATLERDLIRPLVVYNFGGDFTARLPRIRWDCDEAANLKETADVYRTLACDMGLPIPLSHLYDTFSIPAPKEGEPVTSLQSSPPVPMTALALSAGSSPAVRRALESQQRIDQLADTAAKESGDAFDRLMSPLTELTQQADSLADIAAALEDEETVLRLTQRMDAGALQELVARMSWLAELQGRALEDTSHDGG